MRASRSSQASLPSSGPEFAPEACCKETRNMPTCWVSMLSTCCTSLLCITLFPSRLPLPLVPYTKADKYIGMHFAACILPLTCPLDTMRREAAAMFHCFLPYIWAQLWKLGMVHNEREPL